MILISPRADARQTPPVRRPFDPSEDRDAVGEWEWDRVVALYSFVRARAFEHLHEDERSGNLKARTVHRQVILLIDAMLIEAQHGDSVVVSCAVTFFRGRAMRDANHPEFLGEWLGVPAAAGLPDG